MQFADDSAPSVSLESLSTSVRPDAQEDKENVPTSSDSAGSDTASIDGRSVDGRSIDGRSIDGRSVDGRSVDGRSVDGRSVDGRSVDGRSVDGRSVDAGVPGRADDGPGPALLDGLTLSAMEWPETPTGSLAGSVASGRSDRGFDSDGSEWSIVSAPSRALGASPVVVARPDGLGAAQRADEGAAR
jgi:hypothetical protein